VRSRPADGVVLADTRTGEVVQGPDLDSHGFMDDPTMVFDRATQAIRDELASLTVPLEVEQIRRHVRTAVNRVTRQETGRKAVVIVVVLFLQTWRASIIPLVAVPVYAVLERDTWLPRTAELGQTVFTQIDRQVLSRERRQQQERALADAAARLPELAPETISLVFSRSPTGIVEAGEAFPEEPLTPFADDLSRQRHARGDLVIAQPVRGEQDDFGADNVSIR